MASRRISLVVPAVLLACGSTAPPAGPPRECTYYEIDFRYSVGAVVSEVDAGAPAVAELAPACLPPGIASPDDAGRVGCVMFAALTQPGDASVCATLGFDVPAASELAALPVQIRDASGSDPRPMCVVPQLVGADLDATGSCTTSSKPGWCYVTGPAAGVCSQAIFVSPATITAAEYAFACSNGC